MSSTIVQYVVIRGDLLRELSWPLGSLISQGCHAVVAVNHLFSDDEHVQAYLKDLDNMHTIVLDGVDEKNISILKECLVENNIKHRMWTEQPENIPTCLAIKPYPREEVQKYFKKFKLFKKA